MADIIQCKFCNKPFQSFGGRICANCLAQIDEDFITIRDFLYEKPGSHSIDDICRETEVSKAVVLHLMREKRIELNDPSGGPFTCEVCHKPIKMAGMCEKCREALASTLSGSVSQPSEKQPVKTEKQRSKRDVNSQGMHIKRFKNDNNK